MRDPRLPTKKQIRDAKKLLKKRKRWLLKEFLPKLPTLDSCFEDVYLESEVYYDREEEFDDYEEGESFSNEPLTSFDITLAKSIEFPDKKISRGIKRPLEEDKYCKVCRDHHIECHYPAEWTDEIIAKVKEINDRTTKLLYELYDKSQLLRNILNEEYEKGHLEFADFDIEGRIIYKNHKPLPGMNRKLAHILCEYTNHHMHIADFRNTWSDSLFRTEKNPRDYTAFLEMENWNVELFDDIPKSIRLNYYMHTLFCDGITYNMHDIMFMKPEDFQIQLKISTWDYTYEREENK